MLVSLKYKLLQGGAVFKCIYSPALWHVVGAQAINEVYNKLRAVWDLGRCFQVPWLPRQVERKSEWMSREAAAAARSHPPQMLNFFEVSLSFKN